MVRHKPPHLHAKFRNRNRLTLTAAMAGRLDQFHARIPAISKATLARIARKDARILEIKPETFEANVTRTSNLLGATMPAFFKLATRHPALIYLDPWSLRLKLRAIAKGLHTRPKDLIPVIWKSTSLLTRSESSLFAAINAFAQDFDITPDLARRFFLRQPTLFAVKLSTMESNIRSTALLLTLPLDTYTKAALAHPQLFYQSPHTILRNVTDAARTLGMPLHSYLQIALGQPTLFTRSPNGMGRKKRLIQCLMHYARDDRTFEEFLHASKAALTYSPQRILARCLIARHRLSPLKANTLLVMPNKKATALLRPHLKKRFGSAVYPVYRRWKELGLLTTQ